jgi:hypothetical protein
MGFVALTAITAWPTPVQAQWGMGGWGLGWGGFSQVPKPESYLNQKSLVDAGRAIPTPSRDVYANNPNAYINHLRDNGFVEHYHVVLREPSHYRYGGTTGAAPTAVAAAQPSPSLPIASFYNREGRLVWPADAPTAGDLNQQRAVFDSACQVVLDEVKKNSVASISKVTDARRKLLDYGRPALQYTRAHETPRVSDAFHLFLLSLYDSLAQALVSAQARPAAS